MSGTRPSKESTEKPDWCQIHDRWLNMCHYSIGLDNPDFRDEYDKCLAWHDKKIIKALLAKLRDEVEAMDKYEEDSENGYPNYKSPDGYWVPYHEVLALLEKAGE